MGRIAAPGRSRDGKHRHYWKSPYAGLESVGIRAKVVNARHVKNVPGRKTDVGDAHWLATLARAGLLRGSFVPPAKFRELRLIARQRQKLVGQLASEKNRLHKVLTTAAFASASWSAICMASRPVPWSGDHRWALPQRGAQVGQFPAEGQS